MQKDRKVEILAPAGSMDALYAAVSAGADAVYMGGTRFGARAFADNPDQDGVLSAIDYVHLYGRKLYLTVNTLLKPEEMGDALYHYLKPYYKAGLDAVIVQDAGVLEFVSREFPGLKIHLSTQMSLVMAEGAMNFPENAVTRFVPARELGLLELKRMRAATGLEIETFVHGALCYCYSGQCLMSSMIGGRSGNRGRCAQPCRMEYGVRTTDGSYAAGFLKEDLEKNCWEGRRRAAGTTGQGYREGRGEQSGKYLLSPKDICTLDMVPELVEAGIDSFKIEGRMKRYEYAAGVAAAYRAEIDRYFELGSGRYAAFHRDHPEVLRQTVQDLQDLYNRGGFSGGYYKKHNGRTMMSMSRPNHSGVKVGTVVQGSGAGLLAKNRAVIETSCRLNAQDILEIRLEADGGTYEFTLKEEKRQGCRFEANVLPGLNVRPGDGVYRTKNNALLSRLSKQYFEHRLKIGIEGELEAREGQPLRLSVTMQIPCPENPGTADCRIQQEEQESGAGEAVTVTAEGENVQQAKKQPVTEEKLREQIEKTGDTPFFFRRLAIRCGENIFVPVAKLNELRREALRKLESEVCGRYRREINKTVLESGQEEASGSSRPQKSGLDLPERNKEQGGPSASVSMKAQSQNWDMPYGGGQIQVSADVPAQAKNQNLNMPCSGGQISAIGKDMLTQAQNQNLNMPCSGGQISAISKDMPAQSQNQNWDMRYGGERIPVSACVLTPGQLDAVIAHGRAARLYYDLAAMPPEDIQNAAGRAAAAGIEFFVRLPQICRADTFDWLLQKKELLLSPGVSGYLLRNYEELYLFSGLWKKECKDRQLVTDAMLYTMNGEAKRFFRNRGVSLFTAPYELNAAELGGLHLSDMELIVYGRVPLMVSAQCVRNNTTGCVAERLSGPGKLERKKGQEIAAGAGTSGKTTSQEKEFSGRKMILVDRKKKELPVLSCCKFCYSTIYSAECLSLMEYGKEIRRLSPAFLRYDFTTESGEEATRVLSHPLGQKLHPPAGGKADTDTALYTSGHFLRGVE